MEPATHRGFGTDVWRKCNAAGNGRGLDNPTLPGTEVWKRFPVRQRGPSPANGVSAMDCAERNRFNDRAVNLGSSQEVQSSQAGTAQTNAPAPQNGSIFTGKLRRSGEISPQSRAHFD